jgi:hypothetical protein
MNLLLLGGPPRSGKDTVGQYLYKKGTHNLVFDKMSAPLKKSFAAITNSHINEFFEVDYYEDHKDEIIPWLGCSYRQYQINLSEKHFKPMYGQDIFAKLFAARLSTYDKNATVIVPDSGFDIEIQYLEKTDYSLQLNRVLIVRCHREGYDFSNDSRNYVYTDHFLSIDINNDGTAEEFQAKGERILESLLKGEDMSRYNEKVKL